MKNGIVTLPFIETSHGLSLRKALLASIAVALFLLTGQTQAAVLTWTGGSASGNWNIGANWDSGVPPANNDSVVFNAGMGAGLITNNLVGRTLAQISFVGGGAGFTVYGNAIALTGGIQQSSTGGANTFHPDITLATNHQTFAVTGAGAGSGLTISGDINLNGRNLTVNVTDAATELTVSGVISGSGTITRAFGAGGLRLSGTSANTYNGLTTINSGYITAIKQNNIVSVPGDVVIGNGVGVDKLILGTDHQLSGTSDVTLHDGGVLDNNNETNAVGSLTFVNGGTVDATTGRLELNGNVSVTGVGFSNSVINGYLHLGSTTRTFNVANTPQGDDLIINAIISGGGSGGLPSIPAGIVKSGTGRVVLSAANTYNGQTTINEGTFVASDNHALGGTFAIGASAGTVVNSNAVLLLNNAHVTNEVLTLNSTNAGGALQNNATADWVGDIVLDTDVVLEASSAFGLGGEISGVGGFTKIGIGTMTMFGAGANTYSGSTFVNAGTLVLDKSVVNGTIVGPFFIGDGIGGTNADVVLLGAVNQIANTSRLTIAGSGLFDMDGYGDAIGSLVGDGNVDLGSATMNIGFDNTAATFDGIISGTGGLNKFSGTTGTQVLRGKNTYTGTTTINGGTLIVNGTQGNSDVVLGANGTLGGRGVVGSIQNAGTISLSTTMVGLQCGAATFLPGSVFNVELDGIDQIFPFGALSMNGTNLLNGSLNISLGNGFAPMEGDQYRILGNLSTNRFVGIFQGLPESSIVSLGLHRFRINYNAGEGSNFVILTYTNSPLRVAAPRVLSGNGNGLLDPNECNTLNLVVTNTSGVPLTGISAMLSPRGLSLPSVVITQPESTYPNIAVNGRATNITPFQVSTLPSFTCGDAVELKLTLMTAAGNFAAAFDLPSGFLGAPVRFNNNANFVIPDSGSITSSVNVAGISTPVQKVTVSLHVTHTTDEDLDISLVAPDGTTIVLTSDNGGTGDDYGTDCVDGSRTVFDDSAATAITAGAAQFVGTFRPEQQLSAFVGKLPFEVNGTWRLVVNDDSAGGVGTLRCWSLFLSQIACAPGGGACETCLGSVTGSITNGDAIQTGRLTRDGTLTSCAQPKDCPGREHEIPIQYDVHYFSNSSPSAECIRVALTTLAPDQCFSAAYLGAFNPNDLCLNHLGDTAYSTGYSNTLAYSFIVPAHSAFAVTVNEIDPGGGVDAYSLTLSGTECAPALAISPAAANRVRVHWPTTAVGYQLESKELITDTKWTTVTNEPFVSGGRYSVTNSPVNPTTRYYQLRKP